MSTIDKTFNTKGEDYAGVGYGVRVYGGGGVLPRVELLENGRVRSGKNAYLYLNDAGAAAVGRALIAAGGVQEVPTDSLTRASDISFNEGIIRVAAVHGRTVRFRYAKTPTSPIESRTVIPSDVEKHGDAVLFIGQDPDRGGYRSFRLDRIKGDVEVER